jgi:Protein of unknown function (DUF2844)
MAAGHGHRNRIQLKMLAITVALVVTTAALPAWGSLGGDVSTVQADQAHMQATRRTVAAQSYTVHEMQAANGTVVREFVSAEGKVFGVAWHGPWLPDLQQLFGSYFEQYAQAAQAQAKAQGTARVARRPMMIDVPGLSVQIGGHMRAFSGRAYVPEMLPAGVSAENIQ